MRRMSTVKAHAAQDFQDVGPTKFCRAYISEWPKSEVIDNNICECFNNYILRARSKPIVDMLEDIRSAIMQQIVEKLELFNDISDKLCPCIRAVVEAKKLVARWCYVAHAGQFCFEVTQLGNRFVVNLDARTCTCRYFDIRGIPCSHAIACIQWIRQDPATLVFNYFKKDAYEAVYSRGIPSREEEWPSTREIPVRDYQRKAFRRCASSATKLVTIGSPAPKEGCKMQPKYVFIFSQTALAWPDGLVQRKGLIMCSSIMKTSQRATLLSVQSDENSVMHVGPEESLLPTTSTGAATALQRHTEDSSPL